MQDCGITRKEKKCRGKRAVRNVLDHIANKVCRICNNLVKSQKIYRIRSLVESKYIATLSSRHKSPPAFSKLFVHAQFTVAHSIPVAP